MPNFAIEVLLLEVHSSTSKNCDPVQQKPPSPSMVATRGRKARRVASDVGHDLHETDGQVGDADSPPRDDEQRSA